MSGRKPEPRLKMDCELDKVNLFGIIRKRVARMLLQLYSYSGRRMRTDVRSILCNQLGFLSCVCWPLKYFAPKEEKE